MKCWNTSITTAYGKAWNSGRKVEDRRLKATTKDKTGDLGTMIFVHENPAQTSIIPLPDLQSFHPP
jgi:hypothetical protein